MKGTGVTIWYVCYFFVCVLLMLYSLIIHNMCWYALCCIYHTQQDTSGLEDDGGYTSDGVEDDGGYKYDYDTQAGKEFHRIILKKQEEVGGNMQRFVSNDEAYARLIPGQKLLNVAHLTSISANIEGCYGPPSCFPMPGIAVCEDLRIAMGEKLWLYGIVCDSRSIYSAAYDALKDETKSGVVGSFPRLLPCIYTAGTDESDNELLQRLTNLCSAKQIAA